MTKKILAIFLMTVLAVSAFAQDKNALTEKETKFKETVLDKKGIDPADQWAMEKLWKGYLGMGVTGAVVGSGFLVAGTIVMSVIPMMYVFFPDPTDSGSSRDRRLDLTDYYKKYYGDDYWKGSAYKKDPWYAYNDYLWRQDYRTQGLKFVHVLIGLAIGGVLTAAGCIITPVLCAVGFGRMERTSSVYRKTTGQRLFSFLQKTSLGGGYDWEHKELSVAMAIKL